jgi:ABC-2 type transport system permease protein
MKTELKTNLKAIIARAYVRVVGANREPSWWFTETLLPILSTAAYVYVYKALKAPPEYTGFVILGGTMSAYWMHVLWSMAAQFYWEKEIGNLDLYMIAPISRMSILLGMASGGMVLATTRAVFIFLAGSLIFKVSFAVVSLPKLVAVFVLTLISLYGLGMLFSSLFMLYGREAWHGVTLLQEPVHLVSGFFFPVRNLGFVVGVVASFIPLTLGLDAMRQLAFKAGAASGFVNVNLELSVLAVLCVFFLIAAKYALELMEKLGKKEGRLTLRWQ